MSVRLIFPIFWLGASCSGADGLQAGVKGSADTWSPGDPVPGWMDFSCEEPTGANVISVYYPQPSAFGGNLASGSGLHEYFEINALGCPVNEDCLEEAEEATPELSADIIRSHRDSQGRVGWFDDEYAHATDTSSPWVRHPTLHGPLGYHYVSVDGDSSFYGTRARACLSRVRPDQVRGFLQFSFDPTVVMLPWAPSFSLYDEIHIVAHFEHTFADHAGLDRAEGGNLPSDLSNLAWYYDESLPYDEAWPWDSITDDAIRAELYDRYTPYNWEDR